MQSPRLRFIITIKLKNEEEAAQLDSLYRWRVLYKTKSKLEKCLIHEAILRIHNCLAVIH